MLKLSDFGCNEHNQRQLTLNGSEAELLGDIIYNLPKEGAFHTFICEYGHTHRVSFHIQPEKLYQKTDTFLEVPFLLNHFE